MKLDNEQCHTIAESHTQTSVAPFINSAHYEALNAMHGRVRELTIEYKEHLDDKLLGDVVRSCHQLKRIQFIVKKVMNKEGNSALRKIFKGQWTSLREIRLDCKFLEFNGGTILRIAEAAGVLSSLQVRSFRIIDPELMVPVALCSPILERITFEMKTCLNVEACTEVLLNAFVAHPALKTT